MVEKGIRGGICHVIHRYAEANNKYLKNCNKNKDFPYLVYLDANNLYADGFKQKMHLNSIKS